jgi:cytochrome oxidase assembly protein ShyY1
VYRFLLTRRWLGLLAVTVLVAATCVLLGRWQVHRLEARHANNDLITRNASARPVPPADLVGLDRGPASDQQYARVRATGRYDTAHQLLVRNRPHEGQVGYYVVLPLVTADGPALLVNRGWVPAGESATDVPDVPAPPAGEVTVIGRVRPSEPHQTRGGTPPPGQVTRIDIPQIEADLPYDVYGGYADLVREQPAPRRAPVAIDAPETSEGPHLAYAFQWFLFACMALGGYVVLARREAADRRAAVTGATTTVPVRIAG